MTSASDKYVVVAQYSLVKLVAKVNARMTNGWVPMGGVSVSSIEVDDHTTEVVNLFCQAMMRD